MALLALHRAAGALGLESELVVLDAIRAPGWHVLHLPLEAPIPGAVHHSEGAAAEPLDERQVRPGADGR